MGACAERVRVFLNRAAQPYPIPLAQIEEALGQKVHLTFPPDYKTVATALNSGVPLTFSDNSEMAEQFKRLTDLILNPHAQPKKATAPRKSGLGLPRIRVDVVSRLQRPGPKREKGTFVNIRTSSRWTATSVLVPAGLVSAGCNRLPAFFDSAMAPAPASTPAPAAVVPTEPVEAPGTALGSKPGAKPGARSSTARAPKRPATSAQAELTSVPDRQSISEPEVVIADATPVAAPMPEVPAAVPAAAAVNAVTVEQRLKIYSKDDTDVIPAKLLTTREGGPMFQGVRADMNTMELVVSPKGRVETVRLMTPTKRMTDMLLLSGAKTWSFQPALKDGEPVRYRTMFSWEAVP